MKRFLLTALLSALCATVGWAQPNFVHYDYTFDYFLPKELPDLKNGGKIQLENRFDERIPRPSDVLEFELGEQAIDYNDLLNYMYALDRASDRVSIRKYGKTYENRRFINVIITSPANQQRLEELRQNHLLLSDSNQSDKLNLAEMPVIVNLASTVHGREPSGVNASLAVAYLFAASQDKTILEILDKTILILSPGMSPDGMNRYATWLNNSNGGNHCPDRNSREFHEAWPYSYHNHYWHDANRDMLMCQHPEGVNAVRMYLDWMPNVINDHHETGSAKGVFYSPGHPLRTHPLIPQLNQDITAKIGKYSKAMLDGIGVKSYSGATYDDFYFGKNSAYGDLQGSIGILIEQPRSGSYARLIKGKILDLPMTIRNQAFVGVSTALASYQMREELLAYQRDFFKKTAQEAEADPIKGYVFRANGGNAVLYHFIENMKLHEIDIYHLAKPIKKDGVAYSPEDSYVIPLNQKFYTKFRALWEDMFEYKDVKFYDVTTWSFKRAYNLQNTPLSNLNGLLGEKAEPRFVAGAVKESNEAVAYIFEAKEYYSHNLLGALLEKGVKVSVAQAPFTLNKKSYGCGTAVVELAGQPIKADQIHSILTEAARVNGVDVEAVNKLPNEKANLRQVRLPKVAMVLGQGFNAYNNGEVWFMLDRRFGIIPSRIDFNRLHKAKDLEKYNVMTMIGGVSKEPISPKAYNIIHNWVAQGGTLIVQGASFNNIIAAKLGNLKLVDEIKGGGDAEHNFGIIVNSTLDTTSPIGYGYSQNEVPVFKRNNLVINSELSKFDYAPMSYTATPLLSGRISENNLNRYKSTPSAVVVKCGKGRVIYFNDNLNFRSYWFATMKIFMNSIYFGDFY